MRHVLCIYRSMSELNIQTLTARCVRSKTAAPSCRPMRVVAQNSSVGKSARRLRCAGQPTLAQHTRSGGADKSVLTHTSTLSRYKKHTEALKGNFNINQYFINSVFYPVCSVMYITLALLFTNYWDGALEYSVRNSHVKNLNKCDGEGFVIILCVIY